MIDHLSKTLQALLTLKQTSPDEDLRAFFERVKAQSPSLAESFRDMAKVFASLSNAVIKFDRPVEGYQGDASGTLSLFLFDIRENLELRSNEPIIERGKDQATLRRPPRRVACSYLVTAWFGGAEKDKELKEQALLSQALQVLSAFPVIPNEMLWGSLRDQQPPLPVVTLAADGLKNAAEFWTALGGKLRPSFNVTVTVSLPVLKREEPVDLVKERELRVGEKAPGKQELVAGTKQGPFRIFGRITDPDDAPVRGAIVTAKNNDNDAKLSATADEAGRYSLKGLSTGTYTLRAESGFKPAESSLEPVEKSIIIPDAAEHSCDLKLKRKKATQ